MPDYINPPVRQDSEEFTDGAYDLLQDRWPDWEPNEANPEVALLEAIAQIAAILGTLASSVLDQIFRWFGASLIGIPPTEAQAAQASTTWTMIDNAGYTIPVGTQVGVRAAGDELFIFEVTTEIVVPPGSTTTAAGAVNIAAIEDGESASGLGVAGGPVELIDSLDFVGPITLTGPTSGGSDPEEDDAYLTRLREELTLITPRPITPTDFARRAKRNPSIDRALALDLTDASVTENARWSLTNSNVANALTLRFSQGNISQVTGNIAGNATAAAVETALEALAAIADASADVTCTGGPLGTAPVVIDFAGQFANEYVELEVASGATAAVVMTRPGGWQYNIEKAITLVPIDENGSAVSAAVMTDLSAELQALREVNFIVRVAAPQYDTIDVTFSLHPYPNFVASEVVAAAVGAITLYLSPANWGQPPQGESREWFLQRKVRVNDLIGVLEQVEGVDFVKTVTIEGAANDYTMLGSAPLPLAGAIAGSAV